MQDGVPTSLSNANHVVSQRNSRNAVLLNGSRNNVAAKLDVAKHDRMQARILELGDGPNANWTLLEQLNLSNPKVNMSERGT